jgi:hypothetical protein
MRRRSIILAAALAAPFIRRVQAGDSVDVLLVLAVDVSRSLDAEQAALQRQGYVDALTDPRVMDAIHGGMLGAIGLAYVEWSGRDHQRLVVPWTRIATPDAAQGWVEALSEHPPIPVGWTSVSGAIDFSRHVLDAAPWHGLRRVVDVSGDGVTNSGRATEFARDEAVAAGITINGLPILGNGPALDGVMPLDEYYRRKVSGGPGAFVLPAEGLDSFARAVRRKIIMEIAGMPKPVTGAVTG